METARRIAVFSPQLKLVAISNGISSLAKLMGTDTGSLLRAIKGERVTCNGLYPRFVPDDLIMDIDDFGFDLIKFDLEVLQDDRFIYTTRNQKRTEIIRESEFSKIRDNRRKRYTFNNTKSKKNEKRRSKSNEQR